MRPVSVPKIPANYPEATLKNGQIQVLKGGNKGPQPIKTVTAATKNLYDLWLGNKLAEDGDQKVFVADDPMENSAYNDDFDSNKAALSSVTGYRSARHDMVAALGGYCSYCELPLSSSLAIEHKAPKSWFPDSALSWSNFLLACPICNSIKNNTPSQNFENTYLSTDQAITDINNAYAWPDLYWQGAANNTLLPISYTPIFVSYNGNEWIDNGVIEGNTLADLIDRFERGEGLIYNNVFGFANSTEQDPGKAKFTFCAVAVSGSDGPLGGKVDQTIALTALNSLRNENKQDVSDLRVAYRTQTFFRAHVLRKRLGNVVAASPAMAAPMLNVVLRTAAATGFWGIWALVFRDVDSIQARLRAVFPGTAPVTWTIGG